MQVYVPTTAISIDDYTPVIATYGNDIELPPDTHPNTTCFIFPTGQHVVVWNGLPALASSWRDDLIPVINAEANRRIIAVFPDYSQRNATQYVQDALLRNGGNTDPAQWPPNDQAIKTEADRGWAYVAAVRQASNTLSTSNPTNPCDDSHWPAPITPIKFPE